MKTGIQTTEFWITAIVNIAAAVIGILAARGLLSSEEGELWLALVQAIVVAIVPIVIAYTTGKYIESRSEVKVAHLEAQASVQVASSEAQADVQVARDSHSE